MTNKEYLVKMNSTDWYDAVYWLFRGYGRQYTDTRLAVIDWLDKDYKPVKVINGNMYSFCPHCYNIVGNYLKECPCCHIQFEKSEEV